jgi:1-acyl-sn-glycerol-3-phosphate acyltransferase
MLAVLRATLAFVGIAGNTAVHATPLLLLALVGLATPVQSWRAAIKRVLVVFAENWIAVNNALIAMFARTRWHVRGVEGLRRHGWYLVLSNHQSWVDIPVLQRTFNRRIPFLKFFLKAELIWVPVLGLAWWALDFPFMKRYSREKLARHPELRGRDIEATRRACARFRDLPVSVMNFVEGTRLTAAKHGHQASPYDHLLKPKAGGVGSVLEAMGGSLRSLIDVTIVYPGGRPDMFDLLAGRVRDVIVHVRELPIPSALAGGDYASDEAARGRLQDWINGLWRDKDVLIGQLLAEFRACAPSAA